MRFRYLRWVASGVGLVLLLLAVGLGVYSNTEAFRQLVREQVIAAINGSIRGTVSLGPIEGSIWGDVTLHDVRLRHQESDIVRIARLKLVFGLLPLLRGRLEVARAEAAEPAAVIVRDQQGRWNIAEALASDGPSGSQFSLALKSLALRQGTLDLRLGGPEPKDFRLHHLTLDGRLAVDAKGVDFAVRELIGRLQAQTLPELSLKGAFAYLDAGLTPVLKVENLVLASAASRLKLTGEVTEFAKPKLAANLAIEKLAAADLVRFVPDWPANWNLTGSIAANGSFEALRLALDLGVAGAKATGNLTIDIAAPAPRYQGAIKFAGVDARVWRPRDRIAGIVDGSAEVKGVGLALDKLGGAGNFNIRGAEVRGWQLGDMRLQTKLQSNSAELSGALKGAIGGADWRGTVTLTKNPRYDFAVALTNLDIKKVSPAGKALDGVVSLKGTIKGSGLTLAEMKTQANLEILPSSVGAVKLRKGELVATLADGRIRIARGSLDTTDSSLAVKGDIGVDLAQQGKLDYEFRSKNLSSWLALAGQKGSGSVVLVGDARGNFAEVKTRGKLKLANLAYGKLAAKSGTVDFELSRTSKEPVPSGALMAHLAGIQAGVEFNKLDGTVLLGAGTRSARIEFKAQDRSERIHTLQASVDYGQDDIVARVSQLSLNLPDGLWRLAAPATLSKGADAFIVEKLILRNGQKTATLDGRVTMAGSQALNLAVDKFPLSGLAAMLPKEPTMTGLLALQAKLGGSAAAPAISATINLSDATIGGQGYAGFAAELSYKERQAQLNLTVSQDAAHTLTAIGKLPLLLSWHDGWRSEITGDMDVRVKSAGLSLAFLNAYTAKTVSDLDGEISLNVTARGRLAEPSLTGSFQLSGGRLKAIPLNVQINSVAAQGSFDNRRISIQKLSARANDGTFSGSGLLTLRNYQIENFTMSLAARDWPAIDTRRYRAKLGGNIDVDGTLAAPRISGRIDIAEAELRPDLAFLQRSSTTVKRDETITVLNSDGTQRVVPTSNKSNSGLSESELFKKLTLDLRVRMPGNVRVRHAAAAAEARGDFHAFKKPGQDLQLTGGSEIIRGWAAFQGRRFEVVRGDIQLIGGGKLDPALDILAQCRLPGYTVDALVGGTVENPSLVLRSNPSLDQADILALLLFGKPSKDLNRSEQASLKQNALDVTTGFAAANIGAAIADAIGLESSSFGDINFNGGRVGLGRYIDSRTYVTVNQELAGERGQEASLEYQLAPDWKIGSTTTSEGSSKVEIIWHKRY